MSLDRAGRVVLMRFLELILVAFQAIAISGCASATFRHDSKNLRPLELGRCGNGTTRQGFISPEATGDAPCIQGTQTCVAGHWQGPDLFQSCDNFAKSCEGQPHGSVVHGYLEPTSPQGVPCMPAAKTCINGGWSGPEVYPSCFEL